MNSRMSKYEVKDKTPLKRASKNEKLYDEVDSQKIEYIDISNSVDLSALKDKPLKREDYQSIKDYDIISKDIKEETKVVEEKQEKIYDINEILRRARENEAKDDDKKRMLNTEYNILTKLDMEKIDSSKELSKENLRKLIDKIYEKEDSERAKKHPKKEKDLLSDLMDNSVEISEDLSKTILEEETKEVKEEVPEETKEVEEKQEEISDTDIKEFIKEDTTDTTSEFKELEEKPNVLKKVTIVFLVIALISVLVYLFLKYYGTL